MNVKNSYIGTFSNSNMLKNDYKQMQIKIWQI